MFRFLKSSGRLRWTRTGSLRWNVVIFSRLHPCIGVPCLHKTFHSATEWRQGTGMVRDRLNAVDSVNSADCVQLLSGGEDTVIVSVVEFKLRVSISALTLLTESGFRGGE